MSQTVDRSQADPMIRVSFLSPTGGLRVRATANPFSPAPELGQRPWGNPCVLPSRGVDLAPSRGARDPVPRARQAPATLGAISVELTVAAKRVRPPAQLETYPPAGRASRGGA
jgi:hypothetical protein